MTRYLGLTGSIATGKSTVAKIFQEKNIPVIDCDRLVRDLQHPGSQVLQVIRQRFGEEFVFSNGRLNRKKLGQLIFKNSKKRELLNQLLAPFIKVAILKEMEKYHGKASLVVVDIPLLFEQNYQEIVDEVMVVYAPEEVQITRLSRRDALNFKEAKERIASQIEIEEKRKRADVVIDNSGGVEQTRKQVECWLKKQEGKSKEG